MKTLKEIVQILNEVDFPGANRIIWVGKNYSKQNLIDDINEIIKKEQYENFDDTAQAPGNSY